MAAKTPAKSAQPTKPSGARPGIIILSLILVLVAFGCGFGALTVQADLVQPVAAAGAPTQAFVVSSGQNFNTIADGLEHQKLIRSALFLKLYMKIKNVSTPNIEPGTYQLSPSMSLTTILAALGKPPVPTQYAFTVPEGSRLSQYPDAIVNSLRIAGQKSPLDTGSKSALTLPNFSKDEFINTTVGGKPLANLDLTKYWYVKPWSTPSFTALEGYLAAGTYFIDPTASTADVIKTMLAGLGQILCPGPAGGDPNAYILDQQQCTAHQAMITPQPAPAGAQGDVGQPSGIFDALHKYYQDNLQSALIVASIAQREARSVPNLEMVASVYYNRWQEKTAETVGTLGADPAEQYYLDSKSGTNTPWGALPDTPKNLTNNPYNLYLTKDLPPSPISGPGKGALYATIDVAKTNYLYFFYGHDCQNHYAATNNTFTNDEGKYGVAGPTDCQS